jgi:hypothetical protein
MIFEKNSTRTRVSFEAGMHQLGGSAIYLNTRDTQLGPRRAGGGRRRGDLAHGRHRDDPHLRAGHHRALRRHSRVPVINGLTNEYHPCQILADIFTFIEHRGPIQGKTVAWVGDSNNMCNTWLQAAKCSISTCTCRRRPATKSSRNAPACTAPTITKVRRSDGRLPRRRPGDHRRLDQHGLRSRERARASAPSPTGASMPT